MIRVLKIGSLGYPAARAPRPQRANQALLPTSTVVTPAADAPVAPTAAAADL